MGSPRWHLYFPVTRSGPAVAQAPGTGMEQSKAVGESGRHQQKGSGSNSRTRRCVSTLQADPHCPTQGRRCPGCIPEANLPLGGLWGTGTEGGPQTLQLTQSLLSDPGFLSVCVGFSHCVSEFQLRPYRVPSPHGILNRPHDEGTGTHNVGDQVWSNLQNHKRPHRQTQELVLQQYRPSLSGSSFVGSPINSRSTHRTRDPNGSLTTCPESRSVGSN